MLMLSAAFALAFTISADKTTAVADGQDAITLTVGECTNPPAVTTQYASVVTISGQEGGYWYVVLTSTTVGPENVRVICDSEQNFIGLMFTEMGGTGGGVQG